VNRSPGQGLTLLQAREMQEKGAGKGPRRTEAQAEEAEEGWRGGGPGYSWWAYREVRSQRRGFQAQKVKKWESQRGGTGMGRRRWPLGPGSSAGQVQQRAPPRRTLSIAVSAAIIQNAQTLEAATALAGQIARAAAVFRVDEVVIFDEPPLLGTGPSASPTRVCPRVQARAGLASPACWQGCGRELGGSQRRG